MDTILRRPVSDPSAWRGSDLKSDSSWTLRLSPEMRRELESAARAVEARGLAAGSFSKGDFPLPSVGPLLQQITDDLCHGRGFALIRGLPTLGDRDHVRTIYWGIGRHLGIPVTQNLQGDLIAEIADRGLDVNALDVKPSQTNAEQRPHTDPADVVGLLCINRAQSGGVSRIASLMTIYNEILAHHPEYLEVLHRGFHHDLRGDASEAAPFGCTLRHIPVYRYHQGALSAVFNASTIKDAQRRMGRVLPAAEMAAVDYVVECAQRDDIRLDMEFEPGDLQLLNNYTILHWRTAFTDAADPAQKRLLLRLWLHAPGCRPVDPALAAGYITGAKTGARTAAVNY